MPRQRYKVFQNTEHYPYFITCTTVQWLPLFTRAEVCQILIDVWLYQRQHKQWKIYAWVILDNHIHAILAAPDLAKPQCFIKSVALA